MGVESGIKNLRAHFIRETDIGTTPDDPDWLRYSDCIRRINMTPNANLYQQRGVGFVNVQNFLKGPEDHALEIQYDLQNWLAASGDAASDGITRASDGGFSNTHSTLLRQTLTGGILNGGRRIYTVGEGGYIGRVSLKGDPNTGEPIMVSLQYVFEKLRSYLIHQPASTGVVTVVSSDAADTTQDVTIENEGAGVTETLSLNGTTPVVGITNFADIDSVKLDAKTKGNITVTHTAQPIMVIYGYDALGGFEGDLGVPSLGSGSFQAALGTSYEKIVGSSILRGGSALETNATVRTLEIIVDNALDVHPRLDSLRRRIEPGIQDITAVASIFSDVGSHESFVEHLRSTEASLVWTLVSGSLTLGNTALTQPGGRQYQAGQAVMQRNNTFTAKSIAAA